MPTVEKAPKQDPVAERARDARQSLGYLNDADLPLQRAERPSDNPWLRFKTEEERVAYDRQMNEFLEHFE